MNENIIKALKQFGREDLTDGMYEVDIDDNIEVFLTPRKMIELNNLQSKIDKANKLIDENKDQVDWLHMPAWELQDILKEQ